MIDGRLLDGRKAYVSASSRGLAFEIAKRLAREGAAVALSSRYQEHLDRARERILQDVPDARVVLAKGDLRIRKEQEGILDRLASMDFEPDVFVCSAGQPPNTHISTLSRSEWDSDQEMILSQAVFGAQRFAPRMRERGFGRFLFLSSTYAKAPTKDFVTSSIVRAGLFALSKAIVDEFAAANVASFVLCLGFVDTPLLRNMALGRNLDDPDPGPPDELPGVKQQYGNWSKDIPARRIGSPAELADVAVYLCSPAAHYLNGSVLTFAGGLDRGIL